MLRIAGADVPYPEPTTPGASKSGKGNTRTDTKPELALRSALHRSGLRFRKDLRIKLGTFAARPDIVFTKRRVAVFIDGCFWHSCPDHGTSPKSNTDYWLPKLEANIARDRRNDEALEAEGWTVIRIWEHEDVGEAADRVRKALGQS